MKLPPPPDRWTIDIANAERLNPIASFGFTERQARFLLNVLLHSGVFVERQYCSFAGIVHGQKSTDFIKSSSSVDSRHRSRRASSRPDVSRPLQAALGSRR
jgi:hypothetical protein